MLTGGGGVYQRSAARPCIPAHSPVDGRVEGHTDPQPSGVYYHYGSLKKSIIIRNEHPHYNFVIITMTPTLIHNRYDAWSDFDRFYVVI